MKIFLINKYELLIKEQWDQPWVCPIPVPNPITLGKVWVKNFTWSEPKPKRSFIQPDQAGCGYKFHSFILIYLHLRLEYGYAQSHLVKYVWIFFTKQRCSPDLNPKPFLPNQIGTSMSKGHTRPMAIPRLNACLR